MAGDPGVTSAKKLSINLDRVIGEVTQTPRPESSTAAMLVAT